MKMSLYVSARGGGGGGELANVVIWQDAIILGTFLEVLPDFWVPFWAIPGFLGIIFFW